MLFSAVINLHRERLWAHKAIRSAIAAVKKIPESEIVIVLDRADEATEQIARDALGDYEGASQIVTNLGDLGRARNAGAQFAVGKYIAFLDGDDVWGEDWPRLGVAELERLAAEHPSVPAVAHPVLNVDFGDGAFWWTQPDQRADDFDPAVFWNTNCWSSGVMAPRALLLQHPYHPRTDGLGFEDWEWNARTMAAGVLHISVPKAVVFIRKKSDGLNVESAAKHQLVAHSPYFEARPRDLPRHKAIPFDKATLSIDEEWLVPQWKAAHRIEPALWPDARAMSRLPRYRAVPLGSVAAIANQIYDRLKEPPTHVILAPCLVKGGADKRVVEYASAAARAGGRPLVLLTDRDDDPSWAKAMPDDVHALNVSSLINRVGVEAGALAIARLLMRYKPVLHVINSRLGYGMVARYGRALRDSGVSPIYASLYGSEESNGRLAGAAFNGWFYGAHERIDRVLSDNLAHMKQLQEVHGWPLSKTTVVRSRTSLPKSEVLAAIMKERAAKRLPGTTRVLWASRIVKGKRLDRLLATARLAHEQKLPLLFGVAGAPLDAFSHEVVRELRKLPNVKVGGKEFDGWAQLAPEKHDVFMFTSETEGMPNIVLEAMALGLPVVSTAVGDVPLSPAVMVGRVHEDDPQRWIDALLYAAGEKNLPGDGIEFVRMSHSQGAFDAALQGAGYFSKLEEKKDDGSTEDRGADGTDARAANGMDGAVEAASR